MVKPILTSHHQIRLLDACPPPVARNGAAAARPGRPVRLCPLERPTARAPSRSGEPKIGLVLPPHAVGLACPNYAAGGSPRQQLATTAALAADPPYNAAAIFSLIGSGGERTEAPQCRHKHPPKSESPFALAIDEIPDLCVLPKFR